MVNIKMCDFWLAFKLAKVGGTEYTHHFVSHPETEKNSLDSVCSAESPPDRPSYNKMEAGSEILYWKIYPKSVSSDKKYTGWRRKIQTEFRKRQFLNRMDHLRLFFLRIISRSIWADDWHWCVYTSKIM